MWKLILIPLFACLASTLAKASPATDWDAACVKQYKNLKWVTDDLSTALCHARAGSLLQFNILNQQSSSTCSHPVILLGEDHNQSSAAHSAESAIAKMVPIAGIEGPMFGEFEKLKSMTALHTATDRETVSEKVKRWFTNQGGIVDEISRSGFYVEPQPQFNGRKMDELLDDPYDKSISSAQWLLFIKNMDGLMPQGCVLNRSAEQKLNEIKNTFSDTDNFFHTFADQVGTKGFPKVTFRLEDKPLASYDYDCSAVTENCLRYMMTARNKRMSEKILSVEKEMPCGKPLLAVVGAAHIGPMTKLLSDHQFVSKADNLSDLPYFQYHADPELPAE